MRVLMTALLLTGAVPIRAATAPAPKAASWRLSADPALADHSVAATAGTLAWCVAQIGAGDAQILIPGPHRYALSGDLMVPANVTLVFERGAVLMPGAAAVLTLDAGIEAGPYQVFAGRPQAFAGRPNVDFVRAQWWGNDGAALAAALRFGTVFLGSATFTVDAAVTVPGDTILYGGPGARIVSTVSGNPSSYFGLLTTPADMRVSNITIRDITFSNREAVGMYALAVAGGGDNITFADCEAEGCGLVFGADVRNITIRDNWCHSSTLEQYGSFDDHHDGIYLAGASQDCIIRGNRIRDWRCHGIAVVAEAVFPPTSLDPGREMLAKRILVEGNTVVARAGKRTAGGIWVSAVQDCRVVNNHVEGYGDVGIDFEGSRNCVASGNVLINNRRNLALFGNCRNILFSNNIVEITRDDVPMTVFLNTYSNAYPTIVDIRNTDIVVANNIFSTRVRTYNAEHGTGNVFERQTASLPALLVVDNYQRGNHLDMRFDCVIRQNTTNGPLAVRIPRGPDRKTVNLVMEENSPAAGDGGQAGLKTAVP